MRLLVDGIMFDGVFLLELHCAEIHGCPFGIPEQKSRP